MTGFCTINGVDAYGTYGIVFEPGTYNEVFTLPVPKERYTYDWGGTNGIEVDETSQIVFQPRQLTLPMILIANNGTLLRSNYNAFRSEIYSRVYNDFVFNNVAVRLRLRAVGGGNITTIGKVSSIGKSAMRIPITFSDDFPRLIPIPPPSLFNNMFFNNIILY